ncbi:MAG TPA: hypothetical protein PLN61_06420 [bacterium]|nr:hypothetical protein [bacterium]HQI48284.1 hypothetical protein [bacterium]HQJ64900.1 hypothetical protein [bacterium]
MNFAHRCFLVTIGALLLCCAAPLHRYTTPTSMPSLVLIEDQIYDLRNNLPMPASRAEVHLRDGRKISGKFLAFDGAQIEISPGYEFKTIEGNTTPVDRRVTLAKQDILILKIW